MKGEHLMSTIRAKDGTTIFCKSGLPHDMCATNPDEINAELLAFSKGSAASASV
jgi:hypothetical protein